jgi:hypothetical protein
MIHHKEISKDTGLTDAPIELMVFFSWLYPGYIAPKTNMVMNSPALAIKQVTEEMTTNLLVFLIASGF